MDETITMLYFSATGIRMESRIKHLLNANHGHSSYSTSELLLLNEYFCETSDTDTDRSVQSV